MRKLMLVLVTFCGLMSCQKNDIEKIEKVEKIEDSTSKRLSAIYVSNDSSSNSQNSVYYFSYNGFGRISRFQTYELYAGDSTLIRTVEFFYDADRKSPWKSIEVTHLEGSSSSVTTNFFVYDNMGRIVRDSVYELYESYGYMAKKDTVTIIQDFTYNGNTIFITQTKPGTSLDTVFHSILISDNNYVSSTYHPSYLPLTEYTGFNLSFDLKANPLKFFDTYIPYNSPSMSGTIPYEFGAQEFFNKNNITLSKFSYHSSWPDFNRELDFLLKYEYNPDGQPVKAVLPVFDSTSPRNYWQYLYK